MMRTRPCAIRKGEKWRNGIRTGISELRSVSEDPMFGSLCGENAEQAVRRVTEPSRLGTFKRFRHVEMP